MANVGLERPSQDWGVHGRAWEEPRPSRVGRGTCSKESFMSSADVYLCGDSRPYVTMQTFSKNCYGVVSSIISLQC